MATETKLRHLSDAEFSRLLDGAEPGPDTEAHLAACSFCRGELEAVQESLGDFRCLSTAWAEMEAPRRLPVPARWLVRLNTQRTWGTGLAATAAAGLLAFWMGFSQHTHRAPLLRAPGAVPTTADLAADNRLLLSIDTELNVPAQSVEAATALRVGDRYSARRTVTTATD